MDPRIFNDPIAAWDILSMGPDLYRIQKLLTRWKLFEMVHDIPGDIVECGVFKGTGLCQFLKFVKLMCPNSNKRVLGFDTFDHIPKLQGKDKEEMEKLYNLANFEGMDVSVLETHLKNIGFNKNKFELIPGDIRETAKIYTNENPGFRISLLHLDLDVEEPTEAALEAFWARVVPNGIVIFDEYAINQWTESNAVDKFFRDKNVRIECLPWASIPTAFIRKPNF